MRPTRWQDVVGQERWLGKGRLLREMLERGVLRSLVLWGPPGCGKTTLARLLARSTEARFVQLSAVLDGVKQLRAVAEAARRDRRNGTTTVLFVDEIHRWNRAQQDALLPYVEEGALILIGATTQNPSFELNAALRSRVQMIRLEPLRTEQVLVLLERASKTLELEVEHEVLYALARASGGDARRALNDLERLATAGGPIDLDRAHTLLQRSDIRHDRDGEDHYNLLSALIKSMRGSDPQASVYWLARLLAGGEPPRTIARRLVIFASEDVGNADPRALGVAVDVARAVELVGMPEARIPLAQAVTWLATSPKSNRAYRAIDAALADVERTGALEVPLHLRNAPTAAMKAEGYGRGYLYPHDHPHHIVRQSYLPAALEGRRYYTPTDHAEEKTIGKRLAWWAARLAERDDS